MPKVIWCKIIGVIAIQKKNIIEFGIVTATFTALAIILTNLVIFSWDRTLFTNGIGDATSGFLWLLYANKDASLWGGTTHLINYPFGEQLGSPLYATWLLVLGPLWLLSLFMPPIAALNVMMLLGFVTGGVAAYYLLKKVIKSRFISFIGAYAITFVPYHIMKAPDHLTNIFIWPLISITGFLVAFWRRQTWWRGAGLASSLAAAIYTDGYYILIAAILAMSLFAGLLVTDLFYRVPVKKLFIKIGKLALVVVGAGLLLLPILFVQLNAGSEVSKDLANSRGNIKAEANYYSSKPIDFLLPPEGNVLVSSTNWYNKLVEQKNSRSNMGENATYIGYVVLGLFVVGCGICARGVWQLVRFKKRPPYPGLQNQLLAATTIAVPLMLIWMVAPVVTVFGLAIHTPMDYLTNYVALWRVPSRIFVGMHILVVIAAMIVLQKLTRNVQGWKRWTILTVVLLCIAVETFSTIKRPSFGLDNMPKTYSWLKTQDSVHAIAELPLIDQPIEVSGYYAFGQLIHGKPMVNSVLARNQVGLLNPLGSDVNEETINLLRIRGIDTVLVHERSCRSKSWGALIHSEKLAYMPDHIDKQANMLCTYRLNTDKNTDSYFVYLGDTFAKLVYADDSGTYWNPLDNRNVELTVVKSNGDRVVDGGAAQLEFVASAIKGYPDKPYSITIKQGSKILGTFVSSDGVVISVEVNPLEAIQLEVKTVDGYDVAPGEVGLTSLHVTKK